APQHVPAPLFLRRKQQRGILVPHPSPHLPLERAPHEPDDALRPRIHIQLVLLSRRFPHRGQVRQQVLDELDEVDEVRQGQPADERRQLAAHRPCVQRLPIAAEPAIALNLTRPLLAQLRPDQRPVQPAHHIPRQLRLSQPHPPPRGRSARPVKRDVQDGERVRPLGGGEAEGGGTERGVHPFGRLGVGAGFARGRAGVGGECGFGFGQAAASVRWRGAGAAARRLARGLADHRLRFRARKQCRCRKARHHGLSAHSAHT
ncbi:hypothetical protein CALCODRAFT_462887, partial [Calocera cornea HHB12733]